MRYVRIFALHFQEAFALRSRSIVWFFIALLNPVIYFLFWRGAYAGNQTVFAQWNLSSIATYYFLLVIAGSLLMVHIEEDVGYWDIQQGRLSQFLLKPFSYIQLKFFNELPWRIIQGFFGVIIFAAFWILFGSFVTLAHTAPAVLFAIGIAICGYIISFIFKMIIGISALWFTDYSGLQSLVEAVILVFAGMLMPIDFLPTTIRQIAFSLPFSYMIYFPLLAFQGKLTVLESVRTLGIQGLWIVLLLIIYQVLWRKGVRLFTGLGQ
jgi:ABC-2 type transport system permease protein